MKDNLKLLIALFVFCSISAQAEIKVFKVKDKKAYLKFDATENLSKGDHLQSTDESQTVLVVSVVKGTKAAAKVKKGEAKVGMIVKKVDSAQKAQSKTEDKSKDTSEKKEASSSAPRKLHWGVLAGVNISTMTVKLTSGGVSETANMTGNGFGIKATAQIPLGKAFFLRGGLGYEKLNVEGKIQNAFCQGSSTCVTEIPFFGADGIGGWNIVNKNRFKLNIFAGSALLFPSSPVTNALNASTIKPSGTIKAGMGLSFGKKLSFPIEVEYNLLPPSTDVQTHFIQVRAGISF